MEYPWPEQFSIEVNNRVSLVKQFDDRGLNIAEYFKTKKERDEFRNGLEKEIYWLRRYLFSLDFSGLLNYPFQLEKSESPDFIGSRDGNSFGIEVTVASTTEDQREDSLMDYIKEPTPVGYYGGRELTAHKETAFMVIADTKKAIERKANKIKAGKYSVVDTQELLIYVDGNANFKYYDPELWKQEREDVINPIIIRSISKIYSKMTEHTNINRIALIYRPEVFLFTTDGCETLPMIRNFDISELEKNIWSD